MVSVAVLQVDSSLAARESLERCLAAIASAVKERACAIVVCPLLASSDEQDDLAFVAAARAHAIYLVYALERAGQVTRRVLDAEGRVLAELSDSTLGADSTPEDRRLVSLETPFGKLSLCEPGALLDSAVPRQLALKGAELVCASAGRCARTQLALRLPARARENALFLALAARHDTRREPYPASFETLPPELPWTSEELALPVSQIVTPSGLVHAPAEAAGEYGWAELDLSEARRKERADGSSLLALRKGDLLRAGGRATRDADPSVAAQVSLVAIALPPASSLEAALAVALDSLASARDRGAQLAVLPELFCFDRELAQDAEAAARDFEWIVRSIARSCRGSALQVVTSLVERSEGGLAHMGLLVGQAGVVFRQPQLHVPRRHAWARAGRRAESALLPWGRLAIALAEDALMPELFGLQRSLGTQLVAAPLAGSLAEDALLTLPAVADEFALRIVAAAPSDEDGRSGSLLVDPQSWPARRTFAGQHLLEGQMQLSAADHARVGATLREWTRAPAPALD